MFGPHESGRAYLHTHALHVLTYPDVDPLVELPAHVEVHHLGGAVHLYIFRDACGWNDFD